MSHSGKCGMPQDATADLLVMSLSNCELCAERLNLFNVLNAVLSLWERNFASFWEESEGFEQSKTLTMLGFIIVATGLVSGTCDSAGCTSDSNASAFSSYLTENTVWFD